MFTVYTEDFGKIEVVGRSIRKISSKLRGGISTLWLSEIEFIEGKALKTLTDTVLIDNFLPIKTDPKKLKIAYRIAEISDNLLKKEEKDAAVWELVVKTIIALNDNSLPAVNYSWFYYYFFWNLAAILGYQPEIYFCVHCRKRLRPERLRFSPRQGGVVCISCSAPKGIAIDANTVKILRIILKKDIGALMRLKTDNSHREVFKKISTNFLSAVLYSEKLKNN